MKERTDEAYKKYGVKGYNSYEESLDNEKIDLMVITSPTPFHPSQTITAFERDIDVFLEKPMALTLEKADFVLENMKRHNRKLMLYKKHRISRETQAVKELIGRGIIGLL